MQEPTLSEQWRLRTQKNPEQPWRTQSNPEEHRATISVLGDMNLRRGVRVKQLDGDTSIFPFSLSYACVWPMEVE